METITNAANTVASAASKAILGEPSKEPVSGEHGNTKTPSKDLPVNETAPHVLQSSVPVKDPVVDTLQATKIEPLVPSGTITPTPTETLETTHIAPLEDATPESTLRKAEDKLPAKGSGLAKKIEDKLDVGDKGESSKTADGTPPTAEKTAAPVTTADHKLSLKDKLKMKGDEMKEKLHKH